LFKENKGFTEFICNNDWVLGILKERQFKKGKKLFDILFPDQVLTRDDMVYDNGTYISATVVRTTMVNDGPWERYVRPEVARYIKKNKLVERVKKLCVGLKK
jgi:hypothetical protein